MFAASGVQRCRCSLSRKKKMLYLISVCSTSYRFVDLFVQCLRTVFPECLCLNTYQTVVWSIYSESCFIPREPIHLTTHTHTSLHYSDWCQFSSIHHWALTLSLVDANLHRRVETLADKSIVIYLLMKVTAVVETFQSKNKDRLTDTSLSCSHTVSFSRCRLIGQLLFVVHMAAEWSMSSMQRLLDGLLMDTHIYQMDYLSIYTAPLISSFFPLFVLSGSFFYFLSFSTSFFLSEHLKDGVSYMFYFIILFFFFLPYLACFPLHAACLLNYFSVCFFTRALLPPSLSLSVSIRWDERFVYDCETRRMFLCSRGRQAAYQSALL